jgi:O-antigen/teichoic acid export membrane protein
MLASLVKRAGGVALGIAVGQGMVLLVTPYLARHYSPAEFGALALLMTVSNLSTAAACLRYDLALPSSKESETRGLLVTALVVAGAMAVLAAAVLAATSDGFLAKHAGSLAKEPVLVGSCILLVGFHQATSAWMLGRGAFKSVAGMRLSQGAGFSLLSVIPGFGLLWAHVLSFGAGLIGLRPALTARREGEAPWCAVAWQNRQFPGLSLPGALLDVCGYSLCIWVIASFYGQAMAGNYSQIQRLTGAPLMLVSISLGQILLKQTADISSDRAALRHFLGRVLLGLAVLALAGLVFLWFFGQPIFARLLGAKWKVDREFILFVAVAVFVRACVSPLSSILVTLRRFKAALVWQMLYFCSASLLMPFVAARIGFERYILFYAAHECAFYGLYLLIIYRAIRAGSDSGVSPGDATAEAWWSNWF